MIKKEQKKSPSTTYEWFIYRCHYIIKAGKRENIHIKKHY